MKIYVTYTKKSLVYGDKIRWAVECENETQAQKVMIDLMARMNVKNPRINRCGVDLPDRTHTLFYGEYMNAIKKQ